MLLRHNCRAKVTRNHPCDLIEGPTHGRTKRLRCTARQKDVLLNVIERYIKATLRIGNSLRTIRSVSNPPWKRHPMHFIKYSRKRESRGWKICRGAKARWKPTHVLPFKRKGRISIVSRDVCVTSRPSLPCVTSKNTRQRVDEREKKCKP